jgi:hypothetical protein
MGISLKKFIIYSVYVTRRGEAENTYRIFGGAPLERKLFESPKREATEKQTYSRFELNFLDSTYI